MAIIRAARLADALQRHAVDHAADLQEYHDTPLTLVEEVQENSVFFVMALMFPSDDAELGERDLKLEKGTMDL